jgi:hypothetical protein
MNELEKALVGDSYAAPPQRTSLNGSAMISFRESWLEPHTQSTKNSGTSFSGSKSHWTGLAASWHRTRRKRPPDSPRRWTEIGKVGLDSANGSLTEAKRRQP